MLGLLPQLWLRGRILQGLMQDVLFPCGLQKLSLCNMVCNLTEEHDQPARMHLPGFTQNVLLVGGCSTVVGVGHHHYDCHAKSQGCSPSSSCAGFLFFFLSSLTASRLLPCCFTTSCFLWALLPAHDEQKGNRQKRKQKTEPLGINFMKSQVLYQAAQFRQVRAPACTLTQQSGRLHLMSQKPHSLLRI